MKILVTGGTGFIGSHLAKELMENQIEVILLDLKPGYSLLSGLGQGIEVIEGDLLNLQGLSGILEHYRPQVVVHLAAFRNTESQEKPLGAFRLNCQGTMHVLEAARMAGVQRMVYASSVAVYGSPSYYRQLGFNPYRLTEEAPPNPYNVYGVTKLCTEGMAQQYSLIYGLQTIGLRLPIILGPGKKAGSKTSLFNDLIELPLKGRPARIDSYADQVINFMYVKDTAHALVRACLCENPLRRIYHAGGILCTTREFVAEVSRLLPQAKVELRETNQERQVTSGIDYSLAEKDLNYQSGFSLAEIIKDYGSELTFG